MLSVCRVLYTSVHPHIYVPCARTQHGNHQIGLCIHHSLIRSNVSLQVTLVILYAYIPTLSVKRWSTGHHTYTEKTREAIRGEALPHGHKNSTDSLDTTTHFSHKQGSRADADLTCWQRKSLKRCISETQQHLLHPCCVPAWHRLSEHWSNSLYI